MVGWLAASTRSSTLANEKKKEEQIFFGCHHLSCSIFLFSISSFSCSHIWKRPKVMEEREDSITPPAQRHHSRPFSSSSFHLIFFSFPARGVRVRVDRSNNARDELYSYRCIAISFFLSFSFLHYIIFWVCVRFLFFLQLHLVRGWNMEALHRTPPWVCVWGLCLFVNCVDVNSIPRRRKERVFKAGSIPSIGFVSFLSFIRRVSDCAHSRVS